MHQSIMSRSRATRPNWVVHGRSASGSGWRSAGPFRGWFALHPPYWLSVERQRRLGCVGAIGFWQRVAERPDRFRVGSLCTTLLAIGGAALAGWVVHGRSASGSGWRAPGPFPGWFALPPPYWRSVGRRLPAGLCRGDRFLAACAGGQTVSPGWFALHTGHRWGGGAGWVVHEAIGFWQRVAERRTVSGWFALHHPTGDRWGGACRWSCAGAIGFWQRVPVR